MNEKEFNELIKQHEKNQVLLLTIMEKLGITHEELIAVTKRYKQNIVATQQTSSHEEEVMSDEKTEAYSTEEAPAWNVYYKVNTSEGIYKTKVKQKAWTEKQAIYLGRTEQLFKHMSNKVKAKEIEPKWTIIEAVAEKE